MQQASKSTGEILRVTAKDIKALIDGMFRLWDRMDGVRYSQIITLTKPCCSQVSGAHSSPTAAIQTAQSQTCGGRCALLMQVRHSTGICSVRRHFAWFWHEICANKELKWKPAPQRLGVPGASCGTTVGLAHLGPRYAQKTFPYFNGHGTAETVAHGAQIMMASLSGISQLFGSEALCGICSHDYLELDTLIYFGSFGIISPPVLSAFVPSQV